MELEARARVHAALADRHRLLMVDGLALGDRTFQELAASSGLPGNLAAHHLAVLESAGLIERRVSEGDHRRRYISLRRELLDGLLATPVLEPGFVVFVCTHNSARSQFAAARWRARTGRDADSAGTHPADRVHPGAVRSATRFGLDLSTARPQSWQALTRLPDLVVSVCDRAHEADIPFDGPTLHWSIPDPLWDGRPAAFRRAFEAIDSRLERLASAIGEPGIPLVAHASTSNAPPKGPRP